MRGRAALRCVAGLLPPLFAPVHPSQSVLYLATSALAARAKPYLTSLPASLPLVPPPP